MMRALAITVALLVASCAQTVVGPSMYDLDVDQAESDAASNYRDGSDFLLAYLGVGAEIPGISQDFALVQKLGFVEIRGTSDTPMSPAEEVANATAYEYARRYNAEIVRLEKLAE